MTHDDAFDFLPGPGRVRDRGARTSPRSQSFVAQVMRAATRANGGPLKLAEMRGQRRRGSGQTQSRKGRCSRIGRGQAVADRLKRMAAEGGPGARMRRVVVKARIVRLQVGSRAADAHVRYLQRDGTTATASAVGSTLPRPTRRMAGSASAWCRGAPCLRTRSGFRCSASCAVATSPGSSVAPRGSALVSSGAHRRLWSAFSGLARLRHAPRVRVRWITSLSKPERQVIFRPFWPHACGAS